MIRLQPSKKSLLSFAITISCLGNASTVVSQPPEQVNQTVIASSKAPVENNKGSSSTSMTLYSQQVEGFPSPLSLDYLLNELPVQSPQIFLQNARIAKQQAELKGAESVTGIKINLEGRLSRREFAEQSQAHHRYAIHLGKQLYDFGLTEGLATAEKLEFEANQALQGFVLERHKFQVMQAFFNVILADFQFRIDNEQMAIEYIAFDKSKDRHQVGQISDVAMVKAESDYQQALLNRSRSEQRQLSSRLALANTIGYANVRPDEMKMPSLKVFEQRDLESLTIESLYSQIESDNPELKRLKTLWQAQISRVDALRRANYPEIRADAWAGKLSSQPEVREGKWRADLSLSMPLYDSGKSKSEVLSAQAKAIKLAAEYEQLAQQLRQQVADIYFQLKLLKTELEANYLFGDYADLYLDFSRALYENERATDLGSSMVRLSEANYRMVEWRFKQALLWSQLDVLLGNTISTRIASAEEKK